MALTIKNKTSYELGNNLTEFFSIPIEETSDISEYSRLKDDIYSMDLDPEEKANILNKINSLNTTLSPATKRKIIKEIEQFMEDNDI